MIKRVSAVRRRADLSREEFVRLWIVEHGPVALELEGLREYTVDIVQGDVDPGFDGLATVRFDSLDAMQQAFADTRVAAELARTRESFAAKVTPVIVDEHRLLGSAS
jgi:uncharacterized protein (TIGR02118 family)